MTTTFTKLNNGWDAEPNAPYPRIEIVASHLTLTFLLNPWIHDGVGEFDRGELTFFGCWRYRLGETNDEGWYRKRCRFSLLAPEWGQFYEVAGDLGIQLAPDDWILAGSDKPAESRHFLFYFRDETFECDAQSWSFRHQRVKTDAS